MRLGIGIGLLVFCLLVGIFVWLAMDAVHLEIAAELNKAAELSLTEDWEAALPLVKEAKESWNKHWTAIAAVADHAPMDEIDGLFAQLHSLGSKEESAHFSATCAQLSKLVEAMAEAHRPSLQNLL